MSENEEGQTEVEFYLVYQGKLLLLAGARGREKSRRLETFHRQLASLWDTHPFLVNFMKQDEEGHPIDRSTISPIIMFDAVIGSCR